MLPFPHFEDSVEEKILLRGLSYFKNDAVQEVEVLGFGQFSAIVSGSEDYEIFINIQKNQVIEQTCTCPYFEDYDNDCKHIVAVLYQIRKANLLNEKSSVGSDLENALKEVTEDELRFFVLEYAKRNRVFRSDFFDEFG